MVKAYYQIKPEDMTTFPANDLGVYCPPCGQDSARANEADSHWEIFCPYINTTERSALLHSLDRALRNRLIHPRYSVRWDDGCALHEVWQVHEAWLTTSGICKNEKQGTKVVKLCMELFRLFILLCDFISRSNDDGKQVYTYIHDYRSIRKRGRGLLRL